MTIVEKMAQLQVALNELGGLWIIPLIRAHRFGNCPLENSEQNVLQSSEFSIIRDFQDLNDFANRRGEGTLLEQLQIKYGCEVGDYFYQIHVLVEKTRSEMR